MIECRNACKKKCPRRYVPKTTSSENVFVVH